MKERIYTENEIKELICEGDNHSYKGRFERLRFLLSIQKQSPFPAPALAFEYYEEARLCWYVGAFVATIVMVQLSFEELLKSHYRVAKGVGGILTSGKKVDEAGFFDLIDQAKNDGYISYDEARSFHRIRKNLRNPFVHVKDIQINEDGKVNLETPNFFTQHLKISAPELLGTDVENEAKEAIKLLVTLFPEISDHWGGF